MPVANPPGMPFTVTVTDTTTGCIVQDSMNTLPKPTAFHYHRHNVCRGIVSVSPINDQFGNTSYAWDFEMAIVPHRPTPAIRLPQQAFTG